jgi:predicted dinucleotide-binding enzyme
MKVGILGSGDVGQALANAFKSEGHEVMMATRDPKSKKALSIKKQLNIEIGDFATTAKFAELAVLCIIWTATEQVISLIEPKNLEDKVVIDVTNPLDFSAGMPPSLLIGTTDSAGEQVQKWLKKSKVVKALNTVGNAHMYKPSFGKTIPTMFYCGDDAGAKEVVHTILLSFGWQPVDIGGITGARELEPLCVLWVKYGISTGQWNHVFTVLEK